MNLYAESSAVLAWLIAEPTVPEVRRLLGEAEVIIASDRTLIKYDRVLLQSVALQELTEAEAADRRAHLVAASAHWQVLRIAAEVVDRTRQLFPGDPIRTLDAIHLASLLVAHSAVVGLRLLSLDEGVRQVAVGLGVVVEPA